MLKLTKTGIGLLTKQYKSVLRKCLLLNLGVSFFYSIPSAHAVISGNCNWNTGECNLLVSGGTAFMLYTYDEVYNKNETYTKSEVNNIQSLNYYYTKDQVRAQVGIPEINVSGVTSSVSSYIDSSYKNTASLGGNYIKAYYDATHNEGMGVSANSDAAFYVTLTDGQTYFVDENSSDENYQNRIVDVNNWRQDSNGNWYFSNISYQFQGNPLNPVSLEDRDLMIAKARELASTGDLTDPYYYGLNTLTRNSLTVADNVAVLDDVIGKWDSGNYVKAYDELEYGGSAATGYKSSTIGANLKALDTAIGSWSGGHYILNSTSSSAPADASHLTVGQALSALDEQLYNYYYTFRDDKTVESAEFALFLDNKKLSNVFEA